MGRKKIQISRITDERNRQVTFNKRKFGVMKKAYELSVLCDCEIALIIFSSSNKLYQYASTDMDKILLKYTEYNEPHESLTNKNIIEKEHKNGVARPDTPEQDSEYQLTPRTEAKYNKIDEEFQLMLQRSQINGQQRVSGMGTSNYPQPVTVPYDGGLLQPSGGGGGGGGSQLVHTSISPGPSSSETDLVFSSGAMLDAGNGYRNSTSPMGEPPSPGPSPGPGMSSSKSHGKQHSPIQRSNVRVVVPTALSRETDEIHYGEKHGLGGYPGLTTFGPQDFSIGQDAELSSMSWPSHQIQMALSHGGGGLPHLTVSSSTPSPPSSPLSVNIKSEPISPPREHHMSRPLMSTHSLNLTHHSHHVRPSSAGQLTPNHGSVTPTNIPSPTGVGGSQPILDYDHSPMLKRSRMNDWPS